MLTLLNNGLLATLLADTDIGPWRYVLLLCAALGVVAVSYLLGSLNGAVILSRRVYGADIREQEQLSADTLGMLAAYGRRAALLTALIDGGKTLLALLFTGFLFGFGYAGIAVSAGQFIGVSGLFVLLGHAAPYWYAYRGGKGMLPLAVLMLVLSPIAAGLTLLCAVLVTLCSRFLSLGIVTAAILYPIVMHGMFAVFFNGAPMPAFTSLSLILIAVLVVFLYRDNLKGISERTEPKITFGKEGRGHDGE